ncbi:MAG: hypothetical protein H6719_26475 [Sandaracinaceae bacterium]|nr:hypothetical protein [Sandaracinaceae bacterium]
MRKHALICIAALLAASALGCQRRSGPTPDPTATESGDPATPSTDNPNGRARRAQASRRSAAGSTCAGREDCASDQICVSGTCRFRQTSVSGEILAAAAAGQEQTGDWDGAIETYQAAFARFREADAPVPPRIACTAAELTLRSARDPEARERGARQADLCFRTAVVGHPARVPVQRALARLRYEGLEIALFDAEEPAERFFTQEPSRPTVDVVQVDVQMPDLEPEPRSHTAIRDLVDGEDGRRMIAECFVQDWEVRHESEASAEVVVRYSTRLRDMGSYDTYEPQIAVERTSTAEDGFEPCLARSLPDLFGANHRAGRADPWNQAIRISARIQ